MEWGMSCGNASTETSRARVQQDRAERAHGGRFVDEVERHVGVGLLGERDASEVHVEHATGHRVAADVVDQGRHLAAVEPGQREQRRVAPAAVRKLEGVLIRLDRGRIGAPAEDDTRQQTLPAKGVHLLAEDLARTDAELLCFGHDGSLP